MSVHIIQAKEAGNLFFRTLGLIGVLVGFGLFIRSVFLFENWTLTTGVGLLAVGTAILGSAFLLSGKRVFDGWEMQAMFIVAVISQIIGCAIALLP